MDNLIPRRFVQPFELIGIYANFTSIVTHVPPQEYVQPFELWRDTGQHNLYCGGCEDEKKSLGMIRPLGFMQQYGIGERGQLTVKASLHIRQAARHRL